MTSITIRCRYCGSVLYYQSARAGWRRHQDTAEVLARLRGWHRDAPGQYVCTSDECRNRVTVTFVIPLWDPPA